MTNLTLCSCGLAKHSIRGAWTCEHCDRPCSIKPRECTLCKELAKVKDG